MRPVNKGAWPTYGAENTRYLFNEWANAIEHLRVRTGTYCHLCELPLIAGNAVEHLKSRHKYKRLSNSWTNFLLICGFCNSRKGKSELAVPYRRQYYWPHISNTLLIYRVNTEMLFEAGSHLCVDQKARADRLIELYKLDRSETDDGAVDQRHKRRLKAFSFATRRLQHYVNNPGDIEGILDLAESSGFFSVWFQVFAGYPDVIAALLRHPEFYLDPTWFDAAGLPCARNPLSPDDF